MTTENEEYGAIPIVHLILRKDDKILMLKRTNTGRNDGYYALIAGHKEKNERAIDAIVREAKEEVGIVLDKANLSFVHALYRLKVSQTDERIDLFFTADKWTEKIVNKEPQKHGDLKWFPLNSLPINTVPFVRQAIINSSKNEYFSEFLEDSN